MTRTRWVLTGAAALAAAAAAGGAVVASGAKPAAGAAQEPPVNTAPVERGRLSDAVSQYGTLTYRARRDGSPYVVVDRARGVYTELPEPGDRIACGGVLYRVDATPVLLLCGSTPAYRSLTLGDRGPDVAELDANLVRLGYATRAQLDPASGSFGSETAAALAKLQAALGEEPTGSLALGRAVFLPEPVRVAAVSGELGGTARPGGRILTATSGTLEVQLALDPSQQGQVRPGDAALITLPDNTSVAGTVARLGRIARVPGGQNAGAGGATIPAYVRLDRPELVRGLDQAPVLVEITTRGVENALSVPVTAIVGRAGGGFAVEVVGAGGRRELVDVKLGLFDTAGGRVQVEGALRVGERVVVPST